MSTRLFKQITSMHSVPLYAVVLASLSSFVLLVTHMLGWDLWKVAILILIAWLPIWIVKTTSLYRQYHWHALEHFAIMSVYLRTGLVGTPGLLAHGGAIAGGLPLSRPDLHFLYNLAEETLILIAYVHQIKQTSRSTELDTLPLGQKISPTL